MTVILESRFLGQLKLVIRHNCSKYKLTYLTIDYMQPRKFQKEKVVASAWASACITVNITQQSKVAFIIFYALFAAF